MMSKIGTLRCLLKNFGSMQIIRKFYHSTAGRNHEFPLTTTELSSFDPIQLKLLEEECILVDHNDKPLGPSSKKDCHLMDNINKGMVHRAFSVFLFNSNGELLIQQRSAAKITFPGFFTNTCCSHPLYLKQEMEEKDALGVKRAAQRRLNIELGINPKELEIDELTYITRIQYKAPSNGRWGESEIDYILVAQKDVNLNPNPNEVKSWCYVKESEFKSFIDKARNDGHKFTPWFLLIKNSFLNGLWKNLNNLNHLVDHNTIHRM